MEVQKDKYDIKVTNSQQPSDEQIKKHMDFDGAYKAYSHWAYRTPWYKFQFHSPKNRKIAMFILLILIVGLVWFLDYQETKDQNKNSNPIEKVNNP